MESKHKNRTGALIKKLLIDNVVTILFVVICIAGIILANQPLSYVIGEISTILKFIPMPAHTGTRSARIRIRFLNSLVEISPIT